MTEELFLAAMLAVSAAGASLAGAAPATAPAGAATEPQCVTCHRTDNGGAVSGHSVDEWERSAHARGGVECQDCHGGDPAATRAPDAHQTLYRSGDPRSPLYFKNLPGLCGKCHADEFAAFRRSKHYAELQKTGKGANCVTCHGAMATSIPTGGFLQATCGACHEQPVKVYEALRDIRQTRRVLNRMRELIRQAETDQKATAHDRIEAAAVSGMFQTAHRRWHEFKMADILDELHATSRRAGLLAGEVEQRLAGQPATPKSQ